MTGRIQVYIRKNDLPENQFADFNTWDIGDILGISGSLFKTKPRTYYKSYGYKIIN